MRSILLSLLVAATAASARPASAAPDVCTAGGPGEPCCLTYPDNPIGYQYTCDLGYECVNEICELAGATWHTVAVASDVVVDVDHADGFDDYTGVAVLPGDASRPDRTYAAHFSGGRVDVWTSTASLVPRGGFVLPDRADYGDVRPYGIEQIDGAIWIAYAEPDADGGVRADRGVVAIFDAEGFHVETLPGSTALAAPWGMARAPSSGYGDLNGCTLVGSTGSGQVDAWCRDGESHVHRGPLQGPSGQPIAIDGLHGIAFEERPGDHAVPYVSARRAPGHGWFGTIQWGPVGVKPSLHVCRCWCESGDTSNYAFVNLYVNDIQFPFACQSQCATMSTNIAGIPPLTCTFAP